VCLHACMCVCARACVRVCVYKHASPARTISVGVSLCVCVRARARVRVCVCVCPQGFVAMYSTVASNDVDILILIPFSFFFSEVHGHSFVQ